MAVQAQYPSNILFLNRNEQEGHDYSLQAQTGGLLDHQSHILFNNGGSNNNCRKRGRESSTAATSIIANTPPNGFINNNNNHSNNNPLFSLQSQSQSQNPQLIQLSQLHNHNNPQPNVVSTGLRLSFAADHHNQQQRLQLQQQQQQQQNQPYAFLSLLPDGFASQIKQQRDEIDQFLQAQGEQLRRAISEKRQRHYRAILSAAEESVNRRMREKEAEMEKARRRNAELEARAAQLSAEAQVWQAKAKAEEATAVSLQAQLQQAIMSGGAQDNKGRCYVAEDGVGPGLSCAAGEGPPEDAESAYVDPDRVANSGPKCKGCGKRVASVVALPCRHLCMCTECDAHFRACPLCLNLINSTVEVFLS